MSNKTPEQVTERVIELKQEWMSNRKIKEKIQEELWRSISLWTISNITTQIVQEEIQNRMPDEPDYEVREKDWETFYVLRYKDKNLQQFCEYEVPLSMIKEMTYDFSTHWWNLSQQKILEKYEVTWHFWQTVKSKLKLYKWWNVLDPVSLQQLEESWEDAIDEEIKRVSHRAVNDKYKNKFINQYKTALEKNGIDALKREWTREAIVSGIEKRVKEMWLPKMPPIKRHAFKKSDWTIETITDLHIGKEKTFAIFDRLDAIGQQIIEKPQNTVYLEFLWDLWEIFVEGWRHPWQIESMEWKYWYDLIIQVVEVLTRFVYNIAQHKTVHFIGIWWNHDVLSTAKDWDQARTAALVCYTMIKDRLRDQDNITFVIPRDSVYVYDIDGKIRNIIAHGEEMSKKSLPHIVMEFWDTNMYNIVKYGHLHYTHLKETSDKWLILGCPWLAGKWWYDRRKMLSSNSWTVSVEKNQYSVRNMPKVTINLL